MNRALAAALIALSLAVGFIGGITVNRTPETVQAAVTPLAADLIDPQEMQCLQIGGGGSESAFLAMRQCLYRIGKPYREVPIPTRAR